MEVNTKTSALARKRDTVNQPEASQPVSLLSEPIRTQASPTLQKASSTAELTSDVQEDVHSFLQGMYYAGEL